LNRDPQNWRSAIELGKLHQRMGRNHAAAGFFEKGLDAMPLKTNFDREALEGLVVTLKTMPAVSKVDTNRKSPEQWVEILLNSVEVERRRHAARVISSSPIRHPSFDKAMLRALRDRDHVVKTLAVKTVGEWWDAAEELGNPGLVRIFALLLKDQYGSVRGMAAHMLGRVDHARAVPPLVSRIESERDPYVFGELHRALNRLTFAYIAIESREKLEPEVMERLSGEWKSWYERNVMQFRKYEEERR